MRSALLVGLDLDDTLYPEMRFVESGFRAVATHVGDRTDEDPEDLYAFLMGSLHANGRGHQFDALITARRLDGLTVPKLVDVYRSHRPTISLPSSSRTVLGALRASGHRLFLVTDGDPRVQRNKVTALGLDAFLDGAIYTWDEGNTAGKPNPRGFVRLLEATGASTGELVYVGDNPTKDFIGVNSIGGRTIRVLVGPYRTVPAPTEQHAATIAVNRLRDLPPLLVKLGEQREP
jgi:putative hydrolase of the HAD superfamily